MNSADIRRLCIRRRMRVHFVLPDGAECSIDEHGATQCTRGDVFSGSGLAKLLPAIQEFTLETSPGAHARNTTVSRRELEEMLEEAGSEVRR